MKALRVVVLLCIATLAALPASMPRVHAVLSNGNNFWSAYGPQADNLLYKVYSDFNGVFTDFVSGQLDITDWPIQPGDLSGYVNNPDFFATSKVGDFGIFHLDMNHQDPFLSLLWQCPRTTTSSSCSPAVAPGTSSLTITSTCVMPCQGFALSSDPLIKFINSPPATTPNAPGTWVPGDPVIYDVDGDGVYNAPGTPIDPVISGHNIVAGTNLSIDPKIRYIDDFPSEGIWNTGEATIYDANNNSVYDSGDSVIAGPSGHFNLVIHLKNIEEGNALVKDVNNLVTATVVGQSLPVATKADDGNPNPSGTYGGPWGIGLSTIPPSYNISTAIYAGSALLFSSGITPPVCLPGQQCNADLSVNYNSPGTEKPSVSGIEMSRALSYLVDKPNFLGGSYLTPPGGTPLAQCDDVQVPPDQNLMTSVGAGACNHASAPNSATLAADCAELATLDPTGWGAGGSLLPCTPVSLFNLHADAITGSASCTTGTVAISCFPSQNPSPLGVGSIIGYSGLIDLRASCDHFVAAGFGITGTGGCAGVVGCGNAACTISVTQTAHLTNPVAGGCIASTGVGCIIMYIRTHPPRTAFGQIFADELNSLFGTTGGGTVCYGGPPAFTCSLAPVYFTIAQVGSIVFSIGNAQGSQVADWNLYTGGFFLSSTPDHLYALYHSSFAGSLCGGAANTQPNNYPIYCDPVFDTQANAGENVPGVTLQAFLQTAMVGATRGATVPIYSGLNQFVALNSWNWQQKGDGTGSSLVSVKGHGFESAAGFWSALNMRPVPGYTPSNSLYYASGCNPSTGCQQNTIRRSLAQTTLHMSPYTFTTVWESEPLGQIYDSLLAVDPNTGGLCQSQLGGTANCVDWMTTSHRSSFDVTTGLTTQQWSLRNDIFFHDGQAVTAHDVCFSILSFKNAPSANFLPSVANVVSCSALSSKIAQVILTGQSPFNELNIGGLFILPEHVWAPLCGGVVTPNGNTANADACNGTTVATPACPAPPCPGATALASTIFDPVAAGDMVGSGPWICNPSVGVSTIVGQASCSQNANGSAAGQALSVGGRLLLKRDLGYMRCCSNIQAPENGLATTSLQALEWADANKDGKVTLLDILSFTSHWEQGCSASTPTACYFANPLYSTNLQSQCASGQTAPCVDIGVIDTVATYFDHGLTAPFLGTPNGYLSSSPPGLVQVDPATDPYNIPITISGTETTAWAYSFGGVSNWGQGTSGTISVSGLMLDMQANIAIPAGASYSATIVSAPSGAPLNPCSVTGVGTFSDGTLGPVTFSFAAGATGPTQLQFSFGHCFPSGTYSIHVSYTPPGGSAIMFWTTTVVKP
jgi:hypothetical protein